MNILRVILASIGSIALLFLLCRLIGQRQISQMSMFDYINSISIGSIAAELATNLENWHEPLTAMLVYGLSTALISWITCKNLSLRKLFNGKPILLYEGGKLYRANLLRAKLDINEFLTQCRVAGFFDLSQLQAVVLETNGQFSFLPLAEERPVTPSDMQLKPPPASLVCNLVLDGKILQQNLKASGYNETWLRQQLHSQGIGQLSEVFLATCDAQGNFSAYRRLDDVVQREIFE